MGSDAICNIKPQKVSSQYWPDNYCCKQTHTMASNPPKISQTPTHKAYIISSMTLINLSVFPSL
ncbi:hypothetical protein Syun_023619 [Stephania yunnanensis]|uniref:Uncharacterized protein n=1 Tax=Stephania yunnanensis TaxID=152371 RepID=A0AAP0HZS7_9MAGN